jgi:hypothetical protein
MLYSNFTQQVWYTPESQRDSTKPTRFLLQTIPYRFTSILGFASEDKTINIDIVEFILKNCIIDYRNLYTTKSKDEVLSNLQDFLSAALIDELVSKVLELWSPTTEFMSTMVTTVELMIDPRFSNNTWHCKTCQAKKMDYGRNCPLLDTSEHDVLFKLPFMGEMITKCPVAEKDEALGQTILEGYNFREISELPEAGGIGDQPILFVIGTQHLAERLKHFQRQAEEEALSKSRR